MGSFEKVCVFEVRGKGFCNFWFLIEALEVVDPKSFWIWVDRYEWKCGVFPSCKVRVLGCHFRVRSLAILASGESRTGVLSWVEELVWIPPSAISVHKTLRSFVVHIWKPGQSMRLCAVNVAIFRPFISVRSDISNCSYRKQCLREDDHVRVRMDRCKKLLDTNEY